MSAAAAAATNSLPAGASLAGLYPFPTTNEVASNGTGSGNTIPTVTTMTSPPSSNGVNTLNFQANSDLSSLGLTAALPSESPSLDIHFSSNHNIHKNSSGLCFWASDPFIDRF